MVITFTSHIKASWTLSRQKHLCSLEFALSFPGIIVVKNLPTSAGDTRIAGSVLGSERTPAFGNGNLLYNSCLENSINREAWWATVHGVAKSWTQLSVCTHTHTHAHTHTYAH